MYAPRVCADDTCVVACNSRLNSVEGRSQLRYDKVAKRRQIFRLVYDNGLIKSATPQQERPSSLVSDVAVPTPTPISLPLINLIGLLTSFLYRFVSFGKCLDQLVLSVERGSNVIHLHLSDE